MKTATVSYKKSDPAHIERLTRLGLWVQQYPAGYINGANRYQYEMSAPIGGLDYSGEDNIGMALQNIDAAVAAGPAGRDAPIPMDTTTLQINQSTTENADGSMHYQDTVELVNQNGSESQVEQINYNASSPEQASLIEENLRAGIDNLNMELQDNQAVAGIQQSINILATSAVAFATAGLASPVAAGVGDATADFLGANDVDVSDDIALGEDYEPLSATVSRAYVSYGIQAGASIGGTYAGNSVANLLTGSNNTVNQQLAADEAFLDGFGDYLPTSAASAFLNIYDQVNVTSNAIPSNIGEVNIFIPNTDYINLQNYEYYPPDTGYNPSTINAGTISGDPWPDNDQLPNNSVPLPNGSGSAGYA